MRLAPVLSAFKHSCVTPTASPLHHGGHGVEVDSGQRCLRRFVERIYVTEAGFDWQAWKENNEWVNKKFYNQSVVDVVALIDPFL